MSSRRGAPPRVLPRRALLLALGASALFLGRTGRADPAAVPPEIQASLLSKLCLYDRNFAARAGDTARILIVMRSGSAASESSGTYMKGVLAKLDRFAGLPHEETLARFDSAERLAARCRRERVALVYVTPDLEDQIDAMRAAFTGVDVLTVGAEPIDVERGMVIGFDLVSGKSKILVNLAQARQQNVNFPAGVLDLMKVVSR